MGALGWSERAAMRADPPTIELAYEGWVDQRLALERVIYQSQGIKLPPPTRRGQPAVRRGDWGKRFDAFARAHNARLSRKQAASLRAPPAGSLPPPKP
jgi:hypothetical protein